MAQAAAQKLFKQGLDALLRPQSIAIVGASDGEDCAEFSLETSP